MMAENMLKIKRSRTSSSPRQETRKLGQRTRNSHRNEALNDLIQGGLSEESASKLALSIVSLVSYYGKEIHCRCTGIVVENDQFATSFLTSVDLVTRDSVILPGFQIKVRLPNRKVAKAHVQYYSATPAMLVVTIGPYPHLRAVRIRDRTQVDEFSSDLFAISCRYKTGKLSVTRGTLASSPSGLEGQWSTCQIIAVGSGGPLVGVDGSIVGMNLCTKEGITPFVPTYQIYKCLHNVGICDCLENYSPLHFSSEGTSNVDSIIGSSSRNGSSEVSEDKNHEPHASPIHEADVEWCDLSQELASKLSPSIVSLASFDGEALKSECTGMVIDSKLPCASFLTTGSLFGSVDYKRWSGLTIKVRLPNGKLVHGWLNYYLSFCNLAVVGTNSLLHFLRSHNLRVACLDDNMQVDSAAGVLAVRRCFDSGKLVYTRGSLTGGIQNEELNLPLTGAIQDKELNYSTCKITKAASGGPLVDCDGNIVGMNYYGGKITAFLPSNLIFDRLGPEMFWAVSEEDRHHTDETEESYSDSPKELTDEELELILAPWLGPEPDDFTDRANEMLRTAGHPLPKFADDGMYLKGTFDDEFGHGNWSEPTKRVASKMSRSVVALASFVVEFDSSVQHNKEKRRKHFSCTGVFIECDGSVTRVLTSASLVRTSGEENNIQPGLKIEVCLPSKRRVDGSLQHYDLHYNMAVVSIEGVRSYSAAKLDGASRTDELVALGRSFKSGKLMATNGAKTGKVSRFDCKELQMSTCKITKAGIGGPLVDFDGKFVGMNFYDMEDTPYLPRDRILEVMRHFDAERTAVAAVEATEESEFHNWPVPDAFWFYPSRYPKPPCPPARFELE